MRWIDIHLSSVLGHADIQGNENADRAAQKALNCDVESCLIPHSNQKPLIATHINDKWQLKWDENINKLHDMQQSVGKPPQIHTWSQWNEMFLSRCCISHSWLIHAYLKGNLPLNVLDISFH